MNNNDEITINVEYKHVPAFVKFLQEIENNNFETNTTATGLKTIQQSTRNELRKQGVKALKKDLNALYGDYFDIVETKEGIVIVAENDEFTFSWELKNTIKSLDYDPFIEANNYEEALEEKRLKKERSAKEKADKIRNLELKREQKLKELAAANKINSGTK